MTFRSSSVLVLALDTTTRAGSAALVDEQGVRAQLTGDPVLTHGQRLPADLMRVLDQGGETLQAVQLLAVAAGPGSFTGLRVGIATMQGLAAALDLRIVPVSALQALARAGADGSEPVAAWMDAQRGQVFAALYAADGSTPLIEPTSMPPDDTLRAWTSALPASRVRFIGDGAVKYRNIIEGVLGTDATVLTDHPPLAGVIGQIAIEAPEQAVAPHAVVPIYVRRPDAELARIRPAQDNAR